MSAIYITDQKHGTRRSDYHFVIDGTTATPVMDIGRVVKNNRKETTYEIDEVQFKDKKILRAAFTNSGSLQLTKIDPKDFTPENNYPSGRSLKISDIVQLKFHISLETRQLVDQFRVDCGKMLDDVKELQNRINFKIDASNAPQTEKLLENIDEYIQRCLCMPQEDQRKQSLQQMMKILHQIWCLVKITEALGIIKSSNWELSRKRSRKGSFDDTSVLYGAYKREFSKEPPYNFQREKSFRFWQKPTLGRPTSIFENKSGSYSIWLEFQVPLVGVEKKRPDIVVQKGKHDSLFDPAILDEIAQGTWNFFKHLKQIDLVVECKEFPFATWFKDIEEQIIPYRKAINPKKMILASKERIPCDIKQRMYNEKIIALDGAFPDNEEFLDNLKSEISFLEEN